MKELYSILHPIDENNNTAYVKAMASTLKVLMPNVLTQKQRIVFERIVLYEWTQKAVAELLHISQPTVSRHYKSALAQMKTALEYAACGIKEYIKQNERGENDA